MFQTSFSLDSDGSQSDSDSFHSLGSSCSSPAGSGSSKKQAKHNAARAMLDKLDGRALIQDGIQPMPAVLPPGVGAPQPPPPPPQLQQQQQQQQQQLLQTNGNNGNVTHLYLY